MAALLDGTITLEKIAEFVGLSVDEVRKLKTDQNMYMVLFALKCKFL